MVNDTIYVIGSCDAPPCAVQAYDPSTDSWSSRAPIPQSVGSSFVVINAILYSFAEHDFFSSLRDGYLTTVAYDPATDTWTTKASWSHGRLGFGVAAIDGTAYVVGGVKSAYQAPAYSGAYHP